MQRAALAWIVQSRRKFTAKTDDIIWPQRHDGTPTEERAQRGGQETNGHFKPHYVRVILHCDRNQASPNKSAYSNLDLTCLLFCT